MEQLPASFVGKFIRTDKCWEWTAGKTAAGYGNYQVNGTQTRAHVFAYTALVGPVPAGLELDHLCRNRACVNPKHLEPVTHQVNMKRGANGMKTHCINGHEFTPENTYSWAKTKTQRRCKACHAQRVLKAYHERRSPK